jgi:hypothetical protein
VSDYLTEYQVGDWWLELEPWRDRNVGYWIRAAGKVGAIDMHGKPSEPDYSAIRDAVYEGDDVD